MSVIVTVVSYDRETYLGKKHPRLPLCPLAGLALSQLRLARCNHVTCKTLPILYG